MQTETEKELRRDRRGLIATKEKYEEEIDTIEDDLKVMLMLKLHDTGLWGPGTKRFDRLFFSTITREKLFNYKEVQSS